MTAEDVKDVKVNEIIGVAFGNDGNIHKPPAVSAGDPLLDPTARASLETRPTPQSESELWAQ